MTKEKTTQAEPVSEETATEKKETKTAVETVMCSVSKEQVPLDETIELERKKGETLRVHSRFKKF